MPIVGKRTGYTSGKSHPDSVNIYGSPEMWAELLQLKHAVEKTLGQLMSVSHVVKACIGYAHENADGLSEFVRRCSLAPQAEPAQAEPAQAEPAQAEPAQADAPKPRKRRK